MERAATMSNHISRRSFLAASGAAVVAPMILSSRNQSAYAANDRINIGCIGTRSMGRPNMRNFMGVDGCRVVAICDLDQDVLQETANEVITRYENKDVKTYSDYRELLDRRDIDAVMIATPDHWHAPIAITAARAGKDIYCEKPVTHTHAEGKKLVSVVQENGRIWQTGSWQRSVPHFHRAAEIIRNGHIGELQYAEVILPRGSAYPPANGEFLPPENIDYGFWCGPSPMMPFHPNRLHWDWRWHYNFGGGQMMDWFGHHYDIFAWATERELTGPTSVHTTYFERPQDQSVWNAAWGYDVQCVYEDGLRVRVHEGSRFGVAFYGSEGWLFVNRGGAEGSNPAWFAEGFDPGPKKAYKSTNHIQNFVDSVRSRKRAITTVEISHRSITPGHLGLISAEVGRPIKWDPVNEEIIDDEDATKLIKQRGDKMPWMPWRTEFCKDYLNEKEEERSPRREPGMRHGR